MSVLHAQVEQLLHSVSARPTPQPWEIPIASYRQAGEDLRALSGPVDESCAVEDFTIPVREGVVAARCYRPPVAGSTLLPGVVYLHGGGFVRGSLDTHDRLCRELCVQGGLVVVSVAYRLAPENRYPAAQNDAADAFSWVSEHGDGSGIDVESLAIAGDSSGGALAAGIALASRAQGPLVKAQGLLCPALDATMSGESVERYADGPFLTRATLEWAYDLYVPDADDRRSSLASPLLTQDLTGAPPAVIVSAQVDPVADDAQRYGERLAAAGIEVRRHEYEGMPHSFPLLAGVLDDGGHAITVFARELSELLA
ncbi:alpha/beta hydrolase [Pseudonocardia sp. MH-G8]|uniref:alpha/beta hydrolase n=1 Tax=Pseudonocardia sp. MH-G8 TaxID=1854588 RepID=UPI000BA125DE|nr:alpha/beta hydrolase [Pseudonocardia sp. MH-G8]OZM82785.1 lipase [Pseudonocardia sp. MH-G8]